MFKKSIFLFLLVLSNISNSAGIQGLGQLLINNANKEIIKIDNALKKDPRNIENSRKFKEATDFLKDLQKGKSSISPDLYSFLALIYHKNKTPFDIDKYLLDIIKLDNNTFLKYITIDSTLKDIEQWINSRKNSIKGKNQLLIDSQRKIKEIELFQKISECRRKVSKDQPGLEMMLCGTDHFITAKGKKKKTETLIWNEDLNSYLSKLKNNPIIQANYGISGDEEIAEDIPMPEPVVVQPTNKMIPVQKIQANYGISGDEEIAEDIPMPEPVVITPTNKTIPVQKIQANYGISGDEEIAEDIPMPEPAVVKPTNKMITVQKIQANYGISGDEEIAENGPMPKPSVEIINKDLQVQKVSTLASNNNTLDLVRVIEYILPIGDKNCNNKLSSQFCNSTIAYANKEILKEKALKTIKTYNYFANKTKKTIKPILKSLSKDSKNWKKNGLILKDLWNASCCSVENKIITLANDKTVISNISKKLHVEKVKNEFHAENIISRIEKMTERYQLINPELKDNVYKHKGMEKSIAMWYGTIIAIKEAQKFTKWTEALHTAILKLDMNTADGAALKLIKEMPKLFNIRKELAKNLWKADRTHQTKIKWAIKHIDETLQTFFIKN